VTRFFQLVVALSPWKPCSILGQSMWDLCRTKRHHKRFSSEYFCFLPSVSYHQCPILILIRPLLLREGQTCEVRELSIKDCSFGNHGALDWRVGLLCLQRVKHQPMKVYGRVEVSHQSFLTSANIDGEVRQSPPPLQRKEPRSMLKMRSDGTHCRSECFGKQRNLPLPEI
jgi:hypothetical protein